MTGYPYIIELFTAILEQSKAIQGRFYSSYRYGAQEINSDQLGELFSEIQSPKKYPLALMPPPHSYIKPSDELGEWQRFNIILFFVKTSFYDEKGVTDRNSKSATSQHTVQNDWHDMQRVGLNFIRVLHTVQRNTRPSYFRMPTRDAVLCIPISHIGVDRVSGVRFSFDIEIFVGCTKEDYLEYPTNLILNLDSHAEHQL